MTGSPWFKCLCLMFLSVFSASALAEIKMEDAVGMWLFDEGDGDVVNDISGKGNPGTFNGTLEWVDGVFGGALDCGTRGHVLVKDSDSLDLNGAWTVAIWVNINPPMNRWQTILNKRFDAETNYVIRLQDTGAWEVMINNGNWVRVGDPKPAQGGEWVHLAGVYDGEETLSLFVNGEQVASRSGIGRPPTNNVDLRLGSYSGSSGGIDGMMDEAAIFTVALEADDISLIQQKGLKKAVTVPGVATTDYPESGATDIPRDVVLSWIPGQFANSHDVYFGAVFDDVNDASRSNPMGVLLSQGQTTSNIDPPGVLEFDTIYYWRVDEVNAPPDNTIFKGDTWSFTTESLAYAIQDVTATSNGASDAANGPENTVNGSGLNADGQHSVDAADMWLATPGADPLWIQYEFDRVYRLHEMLVWNYNVYFELILGFGVKDVTVEYSTDGADWIMFGDVELNQGTARADYVANTVIDLAGVAAKYVRLDVQSVWGVMGQFGLSEVQFMSIPTVARDPRPGDGDVGVSLDTALNWSAGREAAAHAVYLGTDPMALALVGTTAESTVRPQTLNLGTTYYWKVDEVNEAEVPGTWEGDLWTFMTVESAGIEDFESYTDDIDSGQAIFQTWTDGWVNDNGSTVGYFDAPFAERQIVHRGRQSMPLAYNNSVPPFYSETERVFDGPQNWTVGDAESLRLFIHGAPANSPQTLYVTLEDTAAHVATVNHTDPDAILIEEWQPWQIALSQFGNINLIAVKKISIGIGDRDNPSLGGAGIIYVDDIACGRFSAGQ